MMGAALAVLALAAALLQLGAVPTLAFDVAAAPLLPVALLAAWGTVRDPAEVWPALLVAAIALGVASEQRAGWYLLALLPTGAILLAPGARTSMARLTRAPLAAAAGAWAYLVVLLVVGGDGTAIPALGVDLALGAMWTGALAALLACALWPLRAQARGLFA